MSSNHCALLIVDVQNDFITGSLALPKKPKTIQDGGHSIVEFEGAEIVIPKINHLLRTVPFDLVGYTLDWHPTNHISFIRNLENEVDETLGSIDKWPIHCVQNSWGAKLHMDLEQNPELNPRRFTIYKGSNPLKENYSPFFDRNSSNIETNLKLRLQNERIDTILVCGLALDICVANTAQDSVELGFRTFIIEDCSYPLDNGERMEKLRQKLQYKGVEFVNLDDVDKIVVGNC